MIEAVLLALRVILSLLAVLWLLWFLSRRLGKGAATLKGELHVVARQRLGRHSEVALIDVGSRRILLGVGEGEVRLLSDLTEPEVVPPALATVEESWDRDLEEISKDSHHIEGDRFEEILRGARDADRALTLPTRRERQAELIGSPIPHPPIPQVHMGPAHRRLDSQVPTSGVLTGSILAPQTWKAAWRAVHRS